MPQTTRKMPAAARIAEHWAPRLAQMGKIACEADLFDPPNRPVCFACGHLFRRLHRAHILARCEGGSDGVDNLHLLCAACHEDSEFLTLDAYWAWLRHTTFHGCAYWVQDATLRRLGLRSAEELTAFSERILAQHDGCHETAIAATLDLAGYKPQVFGDK